MKPSAIEVVHRQNGTSDQEVPFSAAVVPSIAYGKGFAESVYRLIHSYSRFMRSSWW